MIKLQRLFERILKEAVSGGKKYKCYHGTTINNFKEVKNVDELWFTGLYDDAVLYALMGNEANFQRKLRQSEDVDTDLIYEDPKQLLIDLFDKDDKPIILVYESDDDFTDEYEFMVPGLKKSDLKIKYIDFEEYDKVSPLWVDLQNYLN